MGDRGAFEDLEAEVESEGLGAAASWASQQASWATSQVPPTEEQDAALRNGGWPVLTLWQKSMVGINVAASLCFLLLLYNDYRKKKAQLDEAAKRSKRQKGANRKAKEAKRA